jgi:hypothetical protein
MLSGALRGRKLKKKGLGGFPISAAVQIGRPGLCASSKQKRRARGRKKKSARRGTITDVPRNMSVHSQAPKGPQGGGPSQCQIPGLDPAGHSYHSVQAKYSFCPVPVAEDGTNATASTPHEASEVQVPGEGTSGCMDMDAVRRGRTGRAGGFCHRNGGASRATGVPRQRGTRTKSKIDDEDEEEARSLSAQGPLPVGGCNRLRFCPPPFPEPWPDWGRQRAATHNHTNTQTGTQTRRRTPRLISIYSYRLSLRLISIYSYRLSLRRGMARPSPIPICCITQEEGRAWLGLTGSADWY